MNADNGLLLSSDHYELFITTYDAAKPYYFSRDKLARIFSANVHCEYDCLVRIFARKCRTSIFHKYVI